MSNSWLSDCTCIWSNTSEGGSVWMVSDNCPAAPHPRTWSMESRE